MRTRRRAGLLLALSSLLVMYAEFLEVFGCSQGQVSGGKMLFCVTLDSMTGWKTLE